MKTLKQLIEELKENYKNDNLVFDYQITTFYNWYNWYDYRDYDYFINQCGCNDNTKIVVFEFYLSPAHQDYTKYGDNYAGREVYRLDTMECIEDISY